VDTTRFTPAESPPKQPTLLVGANRAQPYRLALVLRTLELLPEEWRLLVVGPAPAMATARAERAGTYTQEEAPTLIRRADILLHPKYNDPCPTVVLEALASGLPVVYSASGGTPELVDDAGIGIAAPPDWDQDHPPAPEHLVDAVLAAAASREELAAAARRRAERFDLQPWLARHRELFEAAVNA